MMANVWLGQINKTGLLPPPIYHDHSLTDSNLFAKTTKQKQLIE